MVSIAPTSRDRAAGERVLSSVSVWARDRASRGANASRPCAVSESSRWRPSVADGLFSTSPVRSNPLKIRLR
jgi:hypothetical protein